MDCCWIIVLECGWFANRFVVPRNTDEVLNSEYTQTPAIQFLKEHQSMDRILRPDAMISWWVRKEYPELFPNRLMVHGLQSARGYDVTIPGNYSEFLYAMQRMNPPERVGSYLHVGDPGTLARNLFSAMNVRYILMPVEVKIPDFKLVFEGPPWIYEYTKAFPPILCFASRSQI